ncbi:HTH-type transcriptional regulator FarR [Methylobacterium crusticola]|uniref:HTH-type transcriptional regulator FarR n=1 Tax=Methylobacterium crusticola TaxID=1697972 RepID=A0ABQ4QUY6_9HYPH|nr:homoprotocatechuate degradation operon regulator HpaR [Methylobacterium crusticola]GJD49152.1 HTH-type transcriptional regulator FarR [Methylobacterium crusticola]
MGDPDDTPPPAALRHFSASLPMLLLRAREAVMLRFRVMLRAHGLTEQQWRVLRALTTVETIEASELALATFLLGPSLSRILRDLEGQGLIATGTHAADQRRKLVRLTAAGGERIAAVAPRSEAIYAEITGRFGEARLAALQGLLAELQASLAQDGE